MSVRIRMLKTVRPAPAFLAPGAALVAGRTYEAFRDHRGVLYGIAWGGDLVPVDDGLFDWVIEEGRPT